MSCCRSRPYAARFLAPVLPALPRVKVTAKKSSTLGDPLPNTDPEIALRIYYAQAGEEVFAVARRFHVAPAQILAANQLEEELACLPQAQRLLIPVT